MTSAKVRIALANRAATGGGDAGSWVSATTLALRALPVGGGG